MKATITTPDTLMLGAWVEGKQVAVTGTLRSQAGTLRQDVIAETGDLWPTLVRTLAQAKTINTRHLILFTNAPQLGRQLKQAPAPDKIERQWLQLGKGKGNGEWLEIPYGGNPDHWQVLKALTTYCTRGSWQVLVVDEDKLQKARELYVQNIRIG